MNRGMRTIPVVIFIASLSLLTSAMAQVPDIRRRMYPTQEGFIEVEPKTGAITECKRSSEGYRCEGVTEGDPLLKEEAGPQAQGPPVTRQAPRTDPRSLGPTEEELSRALDVMERFLRRFMDIIREGRPERT